PFAASGQFRRGPALHDPAAPPRPDEPGGADRPRAPGPTCLPVGIGAPPERGDSALGKPAAESPRSGGAPIPTGKHVGPGGRGRSAPPGSSGRGGAAGSWSAGPRRNCPDAANG